MTISVLVADDSPTIRRRAQGTLGEAGYDVHCVEDGEAAWQELESGRRPDVVLCDILMPKLDGYDLCSRIKADSRHAALPVLLLRGTFEPWDEARAHEAGADGFITKPFEPDNLLSTVKDVLEAAAEDAAASPVAEPEEAAGALAAEPADLGSSAPAEPHGEITSPGQPAEEPAADGDATILAPAIEPEVAAPPTVPAIAPEAPAPATASAAEPAASPFGADDDPLALGADASVAAAPAASVAVPATGALDEAALDALARRVAERLAGDVLEKLAWEIVPEVAEALVRKRMVEIESKLQGG
jgi:CheY-like chemotaxis protein